MIKLVYYVRRTSEFRPVSISACHVYTCDAARDTGKTLRAAPDVVDNGFASAAPPSRSGVALKAHFDGFKNNPVFYE